MKKIAFGSIITTLAVLIPTLAAQAYSNQPKMISIDQVDITEPITRDVNWEASDEVVAGDRILDHTILNVTDATNSAETCSINVPTDVTTYRLSTDTCAGLDVYHFYNIQLIEVYDDATESSDENLTFYTNPPQPRSLNVKHLLANSLRLKFKRGVEIAGEYLYIDYIVTRAKNKSKIVSDGNDFRSDNYIDIASLPAAKSLKVKIRFRSNEYGNSPWSDWTQFKTKSDSTTN